MKIVFFGSDAFSIKALEACLHAPGMELVLVVTTPAKKKGRGLKLESSEIFDYAKARNLPVADYPALREARVGQELLALRPDIFVVASYGKLIPSHLLEIPKYRLNVHPSLLPKYRGAAPIHWPILNGDTETGVSIIDVAEKLDAGVIYCQEKIALDPRVNAAELASELARFSYGVLKKVLAQVKDGRLQGVPQNESEVTFAPQLSKQDGKLFFETMTAEEMDRKVRGLQPWPGAYCFVRGERLAILETDLISEACHPRMPLCGIEAGSSPELCGDDKAVSDQTPGTLLAIEKEGGVQIATRKGVLKVLQVRPEGKKSMPAADFVRGRHWEPGAILQERGPL